MREDQNRRSWIYQYEELKNKANSICNKLNDTLFWLDCETGNLSIWSEKWNSFAKVGVDNLIKQGSGLRPSNGDDFFKETRIYYKGIELQHKRNEEEAALIEYIDIKGSLEHSYINISRNGFTEDGEKFFKSELYPGIISAIKEVIVDLDRHRDTCVNVEKETFDEIILRVVDDFCREAENDNGKMDKLIHLLISVSILTYLAQYGEWSIKEKLIQQNEVSKSSWSELLLQIEKRIFDQSNYRIGELLAYKNCLFDLKIYTDKSQRRAVRGKGRSDRYFTFLSLFLPGNHFAIIQKRNDYYSGWSEYLVCMSDIYDNSLKNTRDSIYDTMIKIPKSETDIAVLEKWGNQVIEDAVKNLEVIDNSQQFVLNWLLKNIPTIGLFSSSNGNIRINILSDKIYPTIFLNKNFKKIILQRMLEIATENGIKRFSTIAWQNYENLACKDLPFHMYFVKRGYLSSASYNKCIIPLDGGILKKMRFIIKEKKNAERADNVNKMLIAMDIEQSLREMRAGKIDGSKRNQFLLHRLDVTQIVYDFFDMISYSIKEMKFCITCDLETILDKQSKVYENWKEIYALVVQIFMQEDSEGVTGFTPILAHEGYTELCNAWMYLCLFPDELLGQSLVEKGFKEHYEKDKHVLQKEQGMIEYLQEKTIFSDEQEQVQRSMKRYMNEIVNLLIEEENALILNKMEILTKNYSYFVTNLKASFRQAQEKEQENTYD